MRERERRSPSHCTRPGLTFMLKAHMVTRDPRVPEHVYKKEWETRQVPSRGDQPPQNPNRLMTMGMRVEAVALVSLQVFTRSPFTSVLTIKCPYTTEGHTLTKGLNDHSCLVVVAHTRCTLTHTHTCTHTHTHTHTPVHPHTPTHTYTQPSKSHSSS